MKQSEFEENISHFHQHLEFYNQPIRLTSKEQENPIAAIHEFFTTYHLTELRKINWDWLIAAITTENCPYNNPREREALIFYYQQIEKLAEAAFILDSQYRKKKKKHKT